MCARATGEAMSGVDRAWLDMDGPRNPMVVSGILEFENVADLRQLAATLVERLLRYPRFSQRVGFVDGTARWIDCDPLHVDYHVRLHRLPASGREQALRRAIASELSEDLDHGMPLWRLTFYPRGRDGAVALFRAHHAVADGIALVRVLLTLDDRATVPAAADHPHAVRPRRRPLDKLIQRMEIANVALDRIGTAVAEDLRDPGRALDQLREGRDAVSAMVHLLRLPENNPQRFRAHLAGRRAVAWSDACTLPPIKAFARAHGIKINDLFLAALCGAFRRYLLEVESDPAQLRNLRVSIPVNLRSEDDRRLGNHFGLVMLDLPIGVDDAGTRLALVAERMAALKHSAEAKTLLAGLSAAGHLPVTVEKNLVNFLAAKTATVVSNLPGPAERLQISGSEVVRLAFWPPQTGGVGIGVSLLSYAGRVTIGVSSDVALMAEPQILVDAFATELALLLGVPETTSAVKAAARRSRPAGQPVIADDALAG